MSGHVHVPPLDTAAYDRSPRMKRRIRGKTSLAEIERQERGRSRVPEPPRLRLLNQDPADVPIPEGSVIPSGSPRSGSMRAHPYTPVGDAVGSSSFEFVPSVVNRAASEGGGNESMETTPIPRSSSSPSIVHQPLQGRLSHKGRQKNDYVFCVYLRNGETIVKIKFAALGELFKVRPVQFGAFPAAAEQLFTKPRSQPNIEPNFEALSCCFFLTETPHKIRANPGV